jgi:mannose-6-phosphate isomerase-like protein (cupin superfamily)
MPADMYDFPARIKELPLADIPFEGCTAYLMQGENEQILFMKFEKDVDLPEHAHKPQWGIVLSGKIELEIAGIRRTYGSGETYYIAEGIKHKGRIFAGYADITFFGQKDRYKIRGIA